ncbi:hypothetical protein ES703_106587 [subsurface metagenome]
MDEEKEESFFGHLLKIGILLMGDIIIVIKVYPFSWYLRSLSNLGIFRGALPSDAFQKLPHHLWFIGLTQVFLLYMAGLYTTVGRPEIKKIIIRIFQALFIQMVVLSIFYTLSVGPVKYPLSILPVFFILNILFSIFWRILALRGVFIPFFGIAKPREFILTPEEEKMEALEKCDLLLSKVKQLKEEKEELEGKIEKLGEKISPENERKELTKLLRLRRYYKKERETAARNLIKIKLKVKSEIKPVKREKRQIEKKLGQLKKEMLMFELEKEVEESLPEKEYLSRWKKLGKEIKNEEEERKKFAEALDSYRGEFFEISSAKKFPSFILSILARSKKLVSSFFWLYFEYFFLVKLKLPYSVVKFFREDFARLFIVMFMILLIFCAFLLIFRKEKIAEEAANVAYFLLVIGVVIEFILMMRERRHAG